MRTEVVERPKKKNDPNPKYAGIMGKVKELGPGQALKVNPDCAAQSARTVLYAMARQMGMRIHIRVENRALYVWLAEDHDFGRWEMKS
jgi:hypothetical protein